MYDGDVFNVIRHLKPSGRGELEITDVNNHYVKQNALTFGKFRGWWSDAGTFDSLARVNRLIEEGH
jgi:glucose-1-phosphate thymidylyltransferase